jgi:hypothetical protein
MDFTEYGAYRQYQGKIWEEGKPSNHLGMLQHSVTQLLIQTYDLEVVQCRKRTGQLDMIADNVCFRVPYQSYYHLRC